MDTSESSQLDMEQQRKPEGGGPKRQELYYNLRTSPGLTLIFM